MLHINEKKIELNKTKFSFLNFFFLIALYGNIVRGGVFRMKFRVLSREFESIEIFDKKNDKKQNERKF